MNIEKILNDIEPSTYKFLDLPDEKLSGTFEWYFENVKFTLKMMKSLQLEAERRGLDLEY